MQLQQGLHGKLKLDTRPPFEIVTLDELISRQPLNPEPDVLCLPTLGDNRAVLAVLRAAGYTCLENYSDDQYDLPALVKNGRRSAGQEVCTPLAAIYSDLQNGVDEFVRRKQVGEAEFRHKRRLVLIDSQGPGPCRQGQYPGLHRLFFQRSAPGNSTAESCNRLPCGTLFEFLLLEESEGYRGNFPDWVMLRIYQGLILKGLLQSIYFKAGSACRDYAQFLQMTEEFGRLQATVYGLLESFTGPGQTAGRLLDLFDGHPVTGLPIRYFAYRMHGREFAGPLRRFARRWTSVRPRHRDRLEIMVTGEGYMRLAQAETIFQILLGELGFGRFELDVTPVLSYLELILEEHAERCRSALRADINRAERSGGRKSASGTVARERQKLRTIAVLRFLLREVLARPLYRACGLQMPEATSRVVEVSRELLPTFRPLGEFAPYLGEVLGELRRGTDIVLNVAPGGCQTSSMGEVMTPCIMSRVGNGAGRVQTLLSTEGDVDEEALTLAVLKATGPRRYYQLRGTGVVRSGS
jgi:hypothetical protein